MDKVQFEYQHTGADDTQYTVTWSGYTGGDIPDGLIVGRLSRLCDVKEPAPFWTVFHHSGYVVNYDVALRTRRQAIAFAAELADVAKQSGFTWDMKRSEIERKVVADGTYHSLKEHLIPDAIRKAMAK